MSLGKRIRLNRIFSHATGRLCSVAVDHYVGYGIGLPDGLKDMGALFRQLIPAGPGAVTMNKGVAQHCWEPFAGKVPLIIQAGWFTADDAVMETVAHPEEVLRLGADAIAYSIGVRGANEGKYMKALAHIVDQASRYDLPVIAHIYPRDFKSTPVRVLHDPENIAWAARAGVECGADIIKVAYTGDEASFAQMVAQTPVPVVAAGGPKSDSLVDALKLMQASCRAGGRGATIGRNIWGNPEPGRALEAFKRVILDNQEPELVVAKLFPSR